jgi:predicted Zn-dependent protease
LLSMGQVEEAEAALGELVAAFPANVMIAELHATAAGRRGDHRAAAARWEMMATRFPGRPASVLGQARSLAALGDVDAAEALLTQASERIGHLSDFKAAFAEMASRRRDWAEAAKRWAAVVAGAPNGPKGVTAQAEALAELGELAQAEALLDANIGRFRDNLDFVRVRARLADLRADWIEALSRWEDVRARFPAAYDGHFGAAQALFELRRFDAAESALAEAFRLRPVSKSASSLQYRINSIRSPDAPVAAGDGTPDAGFPIKPQPSPAPRATQVPAGLKPTKKQRRAGRQRRP